MPRDHDTPGAGGSLAARLELLHVLDGWIIARRPAAEIASLAMETLRPRMGVGRSSVIVLDPGAPTARLLAVAEEAPVEGARPGQVYPRAEIIPGIVAEDPTPRIFEDIRSGPANTAAARRMVERGYRAACWVPMVADGEILGAVVHTAIDSTPFTGDAVEMTAEVATQLAIAIRSEREEAVRAADTARMHLLHAIDRATLEATSPAELAQAIAPWIRALAGADRIVVLSFDHVRGIADWLATDQDAGIPADRVPPRLPLDAVVTEAMIDRPEPIVLRDLDEAGLTGRGADLLRAMGLRASAYVPIVVAGRLSGALNIAWRRPEDMDATFMDALRQVTDRLGVALDHQIGRMALERSRRRLELLHRIDQGILSATTSAGLAQVVAEPLRALVGARVIGIAEAGFDPTAGGSIVAYAGDGAETIFEEVKRLPATRVLPPQLRSQRSIVTVPDLRLAPGIAGAQATIDLGCTIGAVVPLVAEDELVGVISLAGDDPAMLDPDALAVAREVGDQLAVAIRHANARAGLERAVLRQGLVHEIDRSILDAATLEEMAGRVADPIRRLLRASRLDISTYDLSRDEGWIVGVAHAEPGTHAAVGTRFHLRESVPMVELDAPAVMVLEDLGAASGTVPLVRNSADAGLARGVWVPLLVGGELVGAISVAGNDPAMTAHETLAAAREVGDQLAVAMQATRVRRAIADREERLRTILEASPNGILTLDATGLIQYANPAAHRLFGYPEDTLVGGPITRLIGTETVTMGRMALADWFSGHPEAGAGEVGHPLDVDARRRDGSSVPVHVLLAPIRTTEGPLAIATVVDLSERAALEARLRQAERLEILGQFAGILAHDVRNYLTAVTVAADFIEDDMPADDPHREDVETIRRAAQGAVDMTRSVLEFSRPAAGAPGVVDVTRHLAGARTMLGRILGPRITLSLDLPDDLPAARIDATGLTQVLGNLATNARDAMPDGGTFRVTGITHEVGIGVGGPDSEADDALPPGRYVQLVFEDTGVGMDQETRERAFEAFYTTKKAGGGRDGTGLGLSSVFLIVNRVGGAIHVVSAPGAGTRFTIDLPVAG